jgi:hypothetical protein
MALNVQLNVSLDYVVCWEGSAEEGQEVNSTKAYVTKDETSRWIFNFIQLEYVF